MASARTIHLDTTLLIDLLKESRRSEPVLSMLESMPIASMSSFSRNELNRTWIRDLVYLYSLTKDPSVRSTADVLSRINQAFSNSRSSGNRYSRMIEIMVAHLELRPPRLTVSTEITWLRNQLARAIRTTHLMWDRRVFHEFKGTNCVRAQIRPKFSDNGDVDAKVPRCTERDIHCSIHTFFESNKAEFDKVRSAIQAKGDEASEQFKKAEAVFKEAELRPTVLCDDAKCVRVGDAVIAVDGKSMKSFGANNDSEWRLIADALGKDLVNPFSKTPAAD